MKRVLYISSRPPFPVSGGREKMIVQSLSFISEKFFLDVVYFKGVQDLGCEKEIKNIGLNVEYVSSINLPSVWRVLYNFLTRFWRSFQENFYYSPVARRELFGVVKSRNPDYIVFDMLRTSQYFEGDVGVVRIVDLDDLLSDRYKKILSGYSSYSVLGTYKNRVPALLRFLERMVRIPLLALEFRHIYKREILSVNLFDSVILTSPLEAEKLNLRTNTNKAIGVSQFFPCRKDKISKNFIFGSCGPVLGFVGNLKTAQNLASVRFIINEVIPYLNRWAFNFKLVICGDYDSSINDFGAIDNNIVFTGYVDDVYSVVDGFDISIMPIAFGTGVKTKVLESLSRGIPTITNNIGVEGLAVDEKSVVIADDSFEIAKLIVDLSNDPSRLRELSLNGLDYVNRFHSKEVLRDKYLSVFQ